MTKRLRCVESKSLCPVCGNTTFYLYYLNLLYADCFQESVLRRLSLFDLPSVDMRMYSFIMDICIRCETCFTRGDVNVSANRRK